MFLGHRKTKSSNVLISEFERPVEVIMKCDDFKSNFARKLSNRYTNRNSFYAKGSNLSPVTDDINSSEKPIISYRDNKDPVEQNIKASPGPETRSATPATTPICSTEVAALQREIETLRWQLGQTEANRQMHIALLEQVMQFLNRIQVQLDAQSARNPEDRILTADVLPTKGSDLPRSQSVIQMNKNHHPRKALGTKTMSKSSYNVNAVSRTSNSAEVAVLKDFSWKQSKFTTKHMHNDNRKLSQEISRLVSLANSVLNTKLPDLLDASVSRTTTTLPDSSAPNKSIDGKENTPTNSLVTTEIEVSSYKSEVEGEITTVDLGEMTQKYVSCNNNVKPLKTAISPSALTCGLEEDFASSNFNEGYVDFTINLISNTGKRPIEPSEPANAKPSNEQSHIFLEDESGFSSMNSFQEVGIPIINIIPATPSQDIIYDLKMDNILTKRINDNGSEWITSTEPKQPIQVFWV